jgi:hypothetical protein
MGHPAALSLRRTKCGEGEERVSRPLRTGYERGFAHGLANDARLFGQIASSPSGQHWIGKFLAKDPQQSTVLNLC